MKVNNLLSTLMDFQAWLTSEMVELTRVRSARKHQPVIVTMGTTGDPFPVLIQKSVASEPQIAQSVEELGKAMKSRTRKSGSRCHLVLAKGRFISRNLAKIRLPMSRAKNMARIDVAMNTPFETDDVFLAFHDPSDQSTGTRFSILKKKEVAPIIQAIRESGCSVERISLQSEVAPVALHPGSVRELIPRNLLTRLDNALLAAIAIVFILGPIAIFTVADHRLKLANGVLGTEIAAAQKSVKQARTRLEEQSRLHEQMSALRAQKEISSSVVYLWEQTSQILPDNTWLSDFNLEGDTLTLSGFSTSAAAIVPLLEQSEQFENPRFTASVSKVPGQNFERFTLQAQFNRAGAGS